MTNALDELRGSATWSRGLSVRPGDEAFVGKRNIGERWLFGFTAVGTP